jgi:hypothetical protein
LLRGWLALAGISEYSLRFLSAWAGVLAVPLVFRLGRWLFPVWTTVGLVAGLLVATSPYHVWYSQEGKMYALVVVLTLLSLDRLFSATALGGWQRWLGYVLATSAAFYVHLLTALMIPVHILIVSLCATARPALTWKAFLVSLAVLTVPYLPMLTWQAPLLLQPGETGFRYVPLPQMAISLFEAYSRGIGSGPTAAGLTPFLALVVAAGMLGALERTMLKSVVVLAGWLLIPVVGLFLVSQIRPLYTARYLVFVLPAYLFLLAAGVVLVGKHSRLWATGLLLAILILNGWSLWQQARMPAKADMRAATRFVTSCWQEGDLVLFQIPYSRHSFEYYLQYPGPGESGYCAQEPPQAAANLLAAGDALAGVESAGDSRNRRRHLAYLPFLPRSGPVPYRWADGLYTNAGMDPDQVDELMAEMLSGSRVVWLVTTEVELWDARRLVEDWLERHAVLTDHAEFTRVAIRRYSLPRSF